MGAIRGNLETDSQPPMAIPLRHFVVALAFLLVGSLVGVLFALEMLPGQAGLVHVHLLLVGWVCVTIMGAMTQFVPVWSGTEIHSRQIAVAQLWLVALGVTGFAASLLAAEYRILPAFGAAMLVGFWLFVYNVRWTLLSARPWDVTERHFAIALTFFVGLTGLGLLLALDFASPVVEGMGVSRTGIRDAHATLAVFGAVLTTVLGALYQLGTMFTQSDLHGVDHHLQRIEELGYPVGVLLLAGGRLVDHVPLARLGGLLVLAGLLAFSAIIARRLFESTVARTPMLTRYAVVATAMALWSLLAIPSWLTEPTAPAALFGSPDFVHLLFVGVIGMVVIGTLYHVVPFIVWVHQYSDRLGLEDVPMIDDLYDDRLATIDFVAVVVGGSLLGFAEAIALPDFVFLTGGLLLTIGFVVFAGNMWLVVSEHGPHSTGELLFGARASKRSDGSKRVDPESD